MKTEFIILIIVAGVIVLGGIILFAVLRAKKRSANKKQTVSAEASQQPVVEPAVVPEEQPVEEAVAEVTEEEQPAEEPVVVPEEQPVEEAVAEVTEEEQPAEEPAVVPEEQPVEEAVAEVTEEEQPAEEPAVVTEEDAATFTDVAETDESDERDEADDDNDNDNDNITLLRRVVEDGKTQYIVIKYSKSFLAKIIQSDEETKSYYSQLKNKLLSFKGVKSRVSWKWETFRLGRKTLAKLRLRGKTLSLCLALNADDYVDTKYYVENISEIKAYADTPCLYRIKNDRRLRYGGELIEKLMSDNGTVALENADTVDYVAQNPYESTEALIERKLIKVLTDEDAQSGTVFKPRESVTAQEADSLMQDELAVSLIEQQSGSTYATDKTKQNIINIDTISQNFNSGERVTLDEIKKRVKGFDKKTTYIKVLARGTLDKALTVEADSFSPQAVKMIVLTGGTVIKR